MAQANLRMLSWRGQQFVDAIDLQMHQRMLVASELVATSAKTSMRGGGSPHVPSQPGQPPHVDTGALRQSIHATVLRARRRVRGFVIAPMRYARALEFGYAPGGLAPRPYLRPALARSLGRVRSILGAPINFHVGSK